MVFNLGHIQIRTQGYLPNMITLSGDVIQMATGHAGTLCNLNNIRRYQKRIWHVYKTSLKILFLQKGLRLKKVSILQTFRFEFVTFSKSGFRQRIQCFCNLVF